MNVSRSAIHYAALGVMSVVIVYAFMLIGSPRHNRDMLQDKATLNELNNLYCHVNNYFQIHKKPPASLKQLKDPATNIPTDGSWGYCNSIADENELEGYSYTPHASSFTICVDFKTGWDEMEKRLYETNYDQYRDFKAGHNCLERQLTEFKRRN